jgi:hypothetical protein
MAATSQGGQDRDAFVRSSFLDVERNALSFLARQYFQFFIPDFQYPRLLIPKFSANR